MSTLTDDPAGGPPARLRGVARPSPWGDRRGGRIGLLGGSFNPAHDGHVHISREALARLGLDAVWWLVSPRNPLKPPEDLAPLPLRLARAERLTAQDPRILPLALESVFGTLRTAETLTVLRRRFPRTRFVWLMGADNLAQFANWYRWRDVAGSLPIAIFDRAPYSKRALVGPAARWLAPHRLRTRRAPRLADAAPPAWVFLPIRRHGASATALRAKGGRLGVPISADPSPR